MMAEPYVAKVILNALSIEHLYPNCYFLGQFADRVSFASQQRRAMNLVWALDQSRNSIAGQRIAIVGGGIAGLTAAAAAISCGADVWVYEAEQSLCPIQRDTHTRYIHPTINFWPAEPLHSITDWPFLNWHAAPCSMVISQIEKQWNDYFADTAAVQKGVRVVSLEPKNKQVELTFDPLSKRSFDIVIVTVGFGREIGLDGHPAVSYWSDSEADRKKVTADKKIWISGSGDGALIDALRVCYSDFSMGRLLIRAAKEADPLLASFQGVEDNAADTADLDQRATFLAERYFELAQRPRIKKVLEPALAVSPAGPLVRMIHRASAPFDFRAAPIHRLLLAAAIQNGLVQPIQGTLVTDAGTPSVRKSDGSIERLDAIQLIVRHGAGGAIEALLPREAVETLKSDEHRKNQDALKSPQWDEGFYQERKAAQFPTLSRRRRSFVMEAARLLAGAMQQQEVLCSVGVTSGPDASISLTLTFLEEDPVPWRVVPARVIGLSVTELSNAGIMILQNLPFITSRSPSAHIYPGALVNFGGPVQHVITCLATRHGLSDVLALCVTHSPPPLEGSDVFVERGSLPRRAGRVISVRRFDGRFFSASDGQIVCILLTVDPEIAARAAPDGFALRGQHDDPLDLLVNSTSVIKWGPGRTSRGVVVAVSGEGVVTTQTGDLRLSNIIFVDGEKGKAFSEPGDSGSLVVSDQSAAIGVIFAGNRTTSYLLPLPPLLELCGIQLLHSEPADASPDPQSMLELGRLRLDEGRFDDALRTITQAVESLERTVGRNHLQTASALAVLGSAYQHMGLPKEAEGPLREVVAIRIAAFEAGHGDILGAQQSLGWCLIDQSRFEEAEHVFRDALTSIKAPSDVPARAAGLYRGLGNAVRRQNRQEEAKDLLMNALRLQTQVQPPNELQLSSALLDLGWLELDISDFEQANSHISRAYEIRRRILGNEHHETAMALQALASFFQRTGKPAEAERILRETVRIRRLALGEQHPRVAATLQSLAFACTDQGKFSEAQKLAEEAVAIRQRLDNKVELADSLRVLAMLMRRRGEFERAQDTLNQSLRLISNLAGPDQLQSSDIEQELGWLYFDMKDFPRALECFQRAAQIRRQYLGEQSANYAASLHGIAATLTQFAQLGEAEDLFRQSLAIRERVLGLSSSAVGGTLQGLGHVLADQGRFDEAESCYRRALEIRESGQNPRDIADALRNLGMILRRQQRFQDAEQFLQRAMRIRQTQES